MKTTMKIKCDKWQVASDTLAARGEKPRHSLAFTLIELLVVISIMGVAASASPVTCHLLHLAGDR